MKNLNGGILTKCNKIEVITIEESVDTLFLSYNSILTLPPFSQTPIDSMYLGRIVACRDERYPTRTIAPFDGSSFSMRIGNRIEEIGAGTFANWKIDSLYIPINVIKVGPTPFTGCSYLNTIVIEDGNEILEFDEGIGFYGSQLRNLYLGRNIRYPEGKSPFSRNKEGLSTLTIGNSVTEICESEFAGCVNLNQLFFPKSIKRIGKQAFYGCESLTELIIPNNIEYVGKDAFNLCTSLTSVAIEDCEEPLTIDNNFMNCELKKIYLGRNIIYPESLSPFSGLDYLDSLTIGSKVTMIGKSAFGACPKLKEVISYAEQVPVTDQYAFTQSYLPSATLYVPYKLYDKYRETIPWSLFGITHNFEGLYNLTYFVDGDEYRHSVVKQGSKIVVEEEPAKEGYSFSGWSEIPKTMPDHDVTITGTFVVNKYKVTYIIDDEVFSTDYVEYGAVIVPPSIEEKEGYTFNGWTDVPEIMPAHDITIYGSFTSGIDVVNVDNSKGTRIYTVSGKRINKLQRGINIVRTYDGKVRKVRFK